MTPGIRNKMVEASAKFTGALLVKKKKKRKSNNTKPELVGSSIVL